MSFPVSGLLDDFNRASLGSNWTTGFFGDSTPVISASQLQAPTLGGWSGARWNVSTYGADCEVYITAVDQPGTSRSLWLRVGGTDANPNGYQVIFDNTAFCKVQSVSAGSATKLGADFTITGYAANSKVGFEASGNTLTVYHMASSASVWSSVTSRTDSTWTGAGYLAWEGFEPGLNDNFSGGNILNAYTETGAGIASGVAAGNGIATGPTYGAFQVNAFYNSAFQIYNSGAAQYNETGAGVAGGIPSGAEAVSYSTAGAGLAGAVAAGAEAVAYTDAGAGIAGTVAAGADARTVFDTGAGIAGGEAAGADVLAMSDGGYGLADAIASGAENYTGGGGTSYNDTGAGVAGAEAGGFDAMTYAESGVTVAGAVASGADGWTMSDTGAAAVGAIGAGLDVLGMVDAGYGLLGAVAAGLDALAMADSGYGLAGTEAGGADSYASAGQAAYAQIARELFAAVGEVQALARESAATVAQSAPAVRQKGAKTR